MRRYELMLVLRPDIPDDTARRSSTGPLARSPVPAVRSSRSPRGAADAWRTPIDRHREGSYHIVIFEAPPEAIVELERSLLITEELLRHLVTRVERPSRSARPDGDDDIDLELDEGDLPSVEDEDDEESQRADRRIRERSRSGRDRLTPATHPEARPCRSTRR